MKERLNCSVYIVEYDQEGFNHAKQYAADGICADLMEDDWYDKFQEMRFDYILFADVLEHLRDPLQVLQKAVSLLKDSGTVLVSLPNVGHNDIVIKLLNGNWDYTALGLLDDTHIHFWGVNNLDQFFEQAGLYITVKDCTIAATMQTEQFGNGSVFVDEVLYAAVKDRSAGEIYQFVLTLQKETYVTQKRIEQVSYLPQNSESIQPVALWQQINMQKLSIADKDRHIQNLEAIITTKEQEIQDRQDWLVALEDKERHIQNQNHALEEKGWNIHNLEMMVEHKETHIQNLDAILEDKNVRIQTLSDIICDKDKRIRYLDETVQEKDEHMDALQSLLADKNQQLDMLIEKQASQEAAAQEVEKELTHYKLHYFAAINQREELKVQLADAENRCAAADARYVAITASTCWRMTKPCRVVIEKIKKILRSNRYTYLCAKGVRSLFHDGVKATWRKVKTKIKERNSLFPAGVPLYSKEELAAQKTTKFPRNIKFSILVPLYNTPEKFLREMIQSVLDQTYSNWELCLADGSDDTHTYVGKICKKIAKKDKRIRYQKLAKNIGISGNTNACIEMSTGEYIALFDHDDLLHPAALFEMMKGICEKNADLLYTDENTFRETPKDAYCPHYKPDYAPDTLRSYNYICHFTAFDRKLLKNAGGGFRSEFDGSQDYDLILRLTEQAEKIVHIPKILYYWRSHANSVASNISAKPYTLDAAKKALAQHLERVGLKGEVLDSSIPSTYKIAYEIKGEPLITMLIPNKDHIDDLKKCLDSVREKSTYQNWEIIVIENNSTEQATFDYYEEIQKDNRIRVVTWPGEFNFSAINNFGAQYAGGEYILLLNNDVEIITSDWLEQMLMFAQREDVGAVGAMLYYPDNTVQHAGVVLGIGGVAGCAHKYYNRGDYGYMSRMTIAQNYSCVTAACHLMSRKVWDEINGLDEEFKVAFNDVDLCMRIRKAGYLVVWTPYAELYHYESKSRGLEDTPEKQKRFVGEIQRFQTRWAAELAAGDPYYNPNLTLDREDFSLR